MDKWEKVKELLSEIERESDLAYDCLMQVLIKEYGEKEAQRLHWEGKKKYDSMTENIYRMKHEFKGLSDR